MKRLVAVVLAAGAMTELAGAGQGPAGRDFTDFQLVTERNIFDPNRRARVRSEGQRQRQVVDSFSFTGTMNYSKGLFAFFDGSSSDYRKVVEMGDKIAGYTVAQIDHDLVKLVQDTNEVKLKVGMQMRRGDDGKWFSAEGSGNGGGNAVASSSRWNAGRSERRSNSFGNGNGNGDRSRDESRSREFGQPMEGAPTAPVTLEGAVLDPNDPVARLMMRRMQETGGNPNAMEAGNPNDQGNPNEGGNPNGPNNPEEQNDGSRTGVRIFNANENPNPSNEK
jgi:hypothetical protein